jgi:hypothetical protein
MWRCVGYRRFGGIVVSSSSSVASVQEEFDVFTLHPWKKVIPWFYLLFLAVCSLWRRIALLNTYEIQYYPISIYFLFCFFKCVWMSIWVGTGGGRRFLVRFFFFAWGYKTRRCRIPRRCLFSRVIYWAVSCSHMRIFEVYPRWTCGFCLITLFLPIHSFPFVWSIESLGVPIYVSAGFDLPTHGNNR